MGWKSEENGWRYKECRRMMREVEDVGGFELGQREVVAPVILINTHQIQITSIQATE